MILTGENNTLLILICKAQIYRRLYRRQKVLTFHGEAIRKKRLKRLFRGNNEHKVNNEHKSPRDVTSSEGSNTDGMPPTENSQQPQPNHKSGYLHRC